MLSMMLESRVQQMSLVSAACAQHRLGNHVNKSDVELAIVICDSSSDIPTPYPRAPPPPPAANIAATVLPPTKT
jgi:hypothetical protein